MGAQVVLVHLQFRWRNTKGQEYLLLQVQCHFSSDA